MALAGLVSGTSRIIYGVYLVSRDIRCTSWEFAKKILSAVNFWVEYLKFAHESRSRERGNARGKRNKMAAVFMFFLSRQFEQIHLF